MCLVMALIKLSLKYKYVSIHSISHFKFLHHKHESKHNKFEVDKKSTKYWEKQRFHAHLKGKVATKKTENTTKADTDLLIELDDAGIYC